MNQTFEVNKEFILEAYTAACSTWKSKLRTKFPEIFKKIIRSKRISTTEIIWKNDLIYKKRRFEFAIGDIVKVFDGSYNQDLNG